ncbi:Cys-tRNA(Pro) deacylase [Haploplasma modicum]|uniref:Cys-tRNA(Pro) deacylase n=1 Tax=Haploplasma modicum TaxID=2150 RepID=UPI00054E81DF|nr:Cys-tRNA(Pro) deacylase [Haploplasma modicum]
MKTNAMRILDTKNIKYVLRDYTETKIVKGTKIASILNENPDQVFKTLVLQGKSKQYYVCIIPVSSELDLKKVATTLDEKKIDLIPQKELLGLTGYVHGGCSPFGMKKQFKTIIDSSFNNFKTIMVSAGKVGLQIELDFKEVINIFEFIVSEIKV